ncbi:MAG: MFS transporter [Candidatus Binataceae bacterium]|nr:MFS transporter [Candidatus Binataceae bacterium]
MALLSRFGLRADTAGGAAGRDRTIIYVTAFLRAAGTGTTGVLMGVYLAKLGFSTSIIGLIIAAGLAGGAFEVLPATFAADRVGRRLFLTALAVLGAIGGLAVASSSHAVIIAIAAFAGMLNGMGKDRGAALVIEQAILPSTTSDQNRTQAFAFYNVLQAAGAALGALLAASPPVLVRLGMPDLAAARIVMAGYGVLMLVTAMLYPMLSGAVETRTASIGFGHVSRDTRRVMVKLSGLFVIDSIGGGFLSQALIAYFVALRFGAGVGTIGLLFFAAHLANGASQFGAAFLARRIGLVNTMVFTHIPGSLLLIGFAFAPNFPIAAILFLIREGLIQMDVPTRQSYVMAIVQPEERTFAAGVTGLVRLGGWAIAPGIAGLAMQSVSLASPLIIGSFLKVGYDLLLYRAFREIRPPEETAVAQAHRQ